MSELHDEPRLADLRALIDAWLDDFADDNSLVAAVDRGTSDGTMLAEPRWYVRLRGEDKEFITVWLTLGQRTLRYETYVLPDPPEHRDEILEHLLRRNDTLVGAYFSVGDEDAVYLRGQIPDSAVTPDELDRVIGTLYTAVEADFRFLVRRAFASKFA
ncbi:MAG: histidine kinase [Acidimicrobiaceae bacterium]|nr:histidine kinase [Acidimicrobiaceae bacterium]